MSSTRPRASKTTQSAASSGVLGLAMPQQAPDEVSARHHLLPRPARLEQNGASHPRRTRIGWSLRLGRRQVSPDPGIVAILCYAICCPRGESTSYGANPWTFPPCCSVRLMCRPAFDRGGPAGRHHPAGASRAAVPGTSGWADAPPRAPRHAATPPTGGADGVARAFRRDASGPFPHLSFRLQTTWLCATKTHEGCA